MATCKYDLFLSYLSNTSLDRINYMIENLKTKYNIYESKKSDTSCNVPFSNEYAKLFEGIYSSSLFVCLVTCDYSLNTKCMREMYLAVALKKNILFIIIDGDPLSLKSLEEKLNISIANDCKIFNANDHVEILKKIQLNLSQTKNEEPSFNYNIQHTTHTQDTRDSIYLKKLKEKLKSHKKFKTLTLPINASDVCQLPNGNILLSSYTNNKLIVLDSQYRMIQMVSFLNNDYFAAISTCHNNSNRMYICDRVNKRLIMTDMQFNYLKSTRHALNYPMGLCYHNYHVYVCEEGSNRVSKFTHTLDDEPTYFNVYKSPWQIKIIGNIACIKHNNDSIRFYDTSQKFKPIATYDGHWGDLCTSGENFVEHSTQDNCFYVYDKYAKLVDTIQSSNELNGLISNYYYHGCSFVNDRLMLTTRTSKKLIIV